LTRFTQGVAFARLSTVLSDLLGIAISEGALINMLDASREAFAAQTNAIRQQLLSGTALQSDETGLRVGKKNWWLWVFHHEDKRRLRRKALAGQGRGGGLPRRFQARLLGCRIAMAGRWALRRRIIKVCLAHLIRDVQYAIDAGDDVFAPDLRHLLGRACRIGRRRDRLADATLKTYAAPTRCATR